jgi:hypothetical protein
MLAAPPYKHSPLDILPDDIPPKFQDYFARPYFNTYLFGSYVFNLKKSHLYGGVNLGYMISNSYRDIYRYPSNNKSLEPVKSKREFLYTNYYITPGLQAGGSYDINRRISVNAEAGIKSVGRGGPWSPYMIPVTAGVRWRL